MIWAAIVQIHLIEKSYQNSVLLSIRYFTNSLTTSVRTYLHMHMYVFQVA